MNRQRDHHEERGCFDSRGLWLSALSVRTEMTRLTSSAHLTFSFGTTVSVLVRALLTLSTAQVHDGVDTNASLADFHERASQIGVLSSSTPVDQPPKLVQHQGLTM
jgi:hypothetical protein